MDSPKHFRMLVERKNVVVIHCIIHLENKCTNVLVFAEVIKNIVQCANFIRARVLDHRQIKAFLEYLNCDYPDVVYFSGVRCHCKAATPKSLWNLQQEIKLFMQNKIYCGRLK